MISFNGVTKRLRSFFTTDADCTPSQPAKPQQAAPTVLTTQEADQVFMTTIAHLPAEEQRKQMQKRQWYRRLARRQGIIEAEQKMDLYYESGSQDHRS